jgi:hypothetical protein
MRKQADALKVCPIPDACLLVMAQRPYRLLGSPETRSLIFLIKNSPDQVECYLDYLQPRLLQIGHGGIAVVWTPAPSFLLTSPTRILHVSMPSEHFQRTTPNTLELLGQIILYTLSRFVPTHIAASFDCQSVVASLQEAQGYRLRPFGHTAKAIFYESVAITDLVPRPTRWTRSHPER